MDGVALFMIFLSPLLALSVGAQTRGTLQVSCEVVCPYGETSDRHCLPQPPPRVEVKPQVTITDEKTGVTRMAAEGEVGTGEVLVETIDY